MGFPPVSRKNRALFLRRARLIDQTAAESEAAMALGFETADWADYDVVLGSGVGEFADCGEDHAESRWPHLLLGD